MLQCIIDDLVTRLLTKLVLHLHLCFSSPRSCGLMSANQHAGARASVSRSPPHVPCSAPVAAPNSVCYSADNGGADRHLWGAHNWTFRCNKAYQWGQPLRCLCSSIKKPWCLILSFRIVINALAVDEMWASWQAPVCTLHWSNLLC
uniref:Uncharacterized protein n=1 Tax=Arundo donax TaxID=35708 RepID=A0A0A9BTQ1_ARUDO